MTITLISIGLALGAAAAGMIWAWRAGRTLERAKELERNAKAAERIADFHEIAARTHDDLLKQLRDGSGKL